MKLEELVTYLMNPEQLEQLYKELGLNIDSESEPLLIYMEGEIDLKSEIVFFESDETEDDLIFEKDGKRFVNIWDIDYAIYLLEILDLLDKGYSNVKIAQRLIEYRLNDA
jgi:hypothetical protein